MEKDVQNGKGSNLEKNSFDISNFAELQYMKIVFVDSNNELCELRADANILDDDITYLYVNGKPNVDINCPTGVVLKFITKDAIHFAKTILTEIQNVNDKTILVLKTPEKTIRQQNRKHYRINTERPCVLLLNDDRGNNQVLIAQSLNLSKGGILLCNLETMFDDEKTELQLSDGDHCHIAVFLKHNLKAKSYAKYIRTEFVNDMYRYAFQFKNMSKEHLNAIDKYIIQDELQLLRANK